MKRWIKAAAFLLALSVLCVSFFGAEAYAASYFPFKSNNFDETPAFSGGEVRFLRNSSENSRSQQLASVVRSASGKVIAVDAGVREDAQHLVSVIREMGGRVDVWLITHPHSDHVGGLLEILEHPEYQITIGEISMNLLEEDWYRSRDPQEAGTAWKLRQDIAASGIPHSKAAKGTRRKLASDISYEVLNEPYPAAQDHAGNNAGVVYEVTLAGKRIIYLGDIAKETGTALVADGTADAHRSPDYVQLSHHGQDGAGYDFYQRLMPKAAIWSAPDWLFTEEGYRTELTKTWMGMFGVDRNYATRKDDVILK